MTDESETLEYELWSHDETPTGCKGDTQSRRTIDSRRSDVERPVPCAYCGEPLDKEGTVTANNTLPRVDYQDTREYIERLDNRGRAILLGMAMRSIRGSWIALSERLAIIGEICAQGVGSALPDDFMGAVEANAKQLHVQNQVPTLSPDGRLFRGDCLGTYGMLWDEVEPTPDDRRLARQHSTWLPHDKTWGSRMLKNFGEDQ